MVAFRFSFDPGECLNCGVCVDVCPVRCLDMTRPQGTGPEPKSEAVDVPCANQGWMTISPVQVARCTGCMVCAMECPMDIIHIDKMEDEVPLAPPQGLLVEEHDYDPEHWQALSDFTRISRKERTSSDPWGTAHKWRPVRRGETWQVWRTWQTDGDQAKARTAPGKTTIIDEE